MIALGITFIVMTVASGFAAYIVLCVPMVEKARVEEDARRIDYGRG